MDFLEFPVGKISMVYGAAATGKTTLCMQLSLEVAENKKVLFVDTENSFSVERIKQMDANFEKILDKIIIFRAKNFKEQVNFLENIDKLIERGNFGLIVIDTLGMYYREELQEGNYSEVNKSVLSNMKKLKHLAEDYNIPVIITNQVYSDMDGEIKHIGGRMIKGFAKYIVELKKEPRRALVLKPEKKEREFKIIDEGLVFN